MNLTNKYIKVFSLKKKEELEQAGFSFLFEKGSVYYFKNNKQPVFKNKFQMKKTTDVSTWDTPLIKDFRQKVKITDVKTGVEMFYESASSAAKANSLLKTTLNYRLNTNGEKIFSDGKTYKRI